MKLLLDENLPVKLKYRFLEHGIETNTVAEKNGIQRKMANC